MSGAFIPFYVSDWLGGTRTLSAEETGIYITLIAMMYESNAPLTMPEDRLARLCGSTTKAFGKALLALKDQHKITVKDGGLWNDRVEIECRKRADRTQSAKSSANARWKKTEQNQSSEDATASETQCVGNANHNHNHKATSVAVREGAQTAAPPGVNSEDRVALLAAMGIGPDGVSGPSSFIGTMGDMAEAQGWSSLGLSLPEQCQIIREACDRQRAKQADWKPRRFGYFTGLMQDFAAKRGQTSSGQGRPAQDIDAKIGKWKKMAGQA